MIFWNFKTPITFLACCLWNFSEYSRIGLGKAAPYVFGLAIGAKKMKRSKKATE